MFSSSAYPNPLGRLVPLSTGSLTDTTWWCVHVCMCEESEGERREVRGRYGGWRKRKGEGEAERGEGEEGD